MKTKSLRVILMIFVSIEVMHCEGCWKEQTDALLGLDLRFESDTDCCQWERIKCDSSTGRVARLNLYHLLLDGYLINYSDFFAFKDLKSLNWG